MHSYPLLLVNMVLIHYKQWSFVYLDAGKLYDLISTCPMMELVFWTLNNASNTMPLFIANLSDGGSIIGSIILISIDGVVRAMLNACSWWFGYNKKNVVALVFSLVWCFSMICCITALHSLFFLFVMSNFGVIEVGVSRMSGVVLWTWATICCLSAFIARSSTINSTSSTLRVSIEINLLSCFDWENTLKKDD